MQAEPILVILAAGMGSRYGGLKQLDAVGPNGEILMDYTIFDAIRAGFKRVVFIIREEFADDFDRLIGDKWRPHIEVNYAFQRMNDLPEPGLLHPEREKPLGTAHALWTARNLIDAPFAVLNADDYYGPDAFRKLYDFLSNYRSEEKVCGVMVAFEAGNTLSEYGTVGRGVCTVQDGELYKIVERLNMKLADSGDAITFADSPEEHLPLDTPVSMNCWGFGRELLDLITEGFAKYFTEVLEKNPLRGEYLLPSLIDDNIQAGKLKVEVKNCSEHWIGVTYREDKPYVQAALLKKAEQGIYPNKLW